MTGNEKPRAYTVSPGPFKGRISIKFIVGSSIKGGGSFDD